MKRFKLKNVVGLTLTLCLTLAVMIPTAFAAAIPFNTGSYNWSISGIKPSGAVIRHEWNGKSEGCTWVLNGGSHTWNVTVNSGNPDDIFADLRRVIPLSIDPTLVSNNCLNQPKGVTFNALSGDNSYYAVISLPLLELGSGTTSMT